MDSNIFCIDHGPDILLVDLNSLNTCKISKQEFTADAVKRIVAEQFSDSRPYFERLQPKMKGAEGIAPTIVTSFFCNYSCEYCYQRPSKAMYDRMTPQGVDAIYNFYKRFCETQHVPFVFDSITVIGGETLLPENREVLQRIIEVWPDQPIRITTNGSYLLHYADFLIDHKVNLTVSLDGTEQAHYARRKTKDLQSYRKAIEGIRLLLAHDLNITVSAVFSPENLDDYCMFFDEMEALGWLSRPNLRLAFIAENGCGSDDQTYDDIIQNLKAFTALRTRDKRASHVDARTLLPGGVALVDALELASAGEYRPYRCGCLDGASYAFLPDGSVSPCIAIQDSRFRIGRFLPEPEINTNFYADLAKRRIDSMEQCRDCPKRVLCRGGCPATVLHRHGDCSANDCSLWHNLDFFSYFETLMTVAP